MADELICMRLSAMKVTRPDQDNSRFCGTCGERVGIYPSGQALLKACPKAEIRCDACAVEVAWRAGGFYFRVRGTPAPGALEEALQRRRH